jgi:hypothetical protein
MSEQFCEIADGIAAIQLTGVDQAHVQITDVSTFQSLIEKTVFPVQNGFFQRPLRDIVVQRGAGNGDIVPLLVKTLKTLAG